MKLKNKKLFSQNNFINGELVEGKNKIEVFNPSNAELVGSVPSLDKSEVSQVISCAQTALQKWKKLSGKERSKILYRWYELILDNQEDLAIILTTEQGKPLAEARGEIAYGASFIEWFSEEAKRTNGETIPSTKQNQKIITFLEPVGAVAAITPWNFPSAMITRKVAPALAAGCSVVLKPSGKGVKSGHLTSNKKL